MKSNHILQLILFGKKENDNVIISEIYPTENIEKSPINFTISNEQLIEGYKIAEDKGLEVIGIHGKLRGNVCN